MEICDRWDIGKGFSDVSSLNNQTFCNHRGWDFEIYARLGKGDSNGHNCGQNIRHGIISASAIRN